MLNYFEVKGSDYEMGFQIGKYFKDYLNKKIKEFDEKVNIAKKEISYLKEKIETKYPNLLQEIYGRADGAQVSRESLLLMFFPEVYKKIDGCTTVIFKKENSILFAHNEDNNNFDFENTALIRYNYGDRFVISYTVAERLSGSAFSYNSYNLAFSCNYIFSDNLNLNNLSRYIVVRDIINSKSIEEVIEKLKSTDVASPFSLNVVDLKNKEAINIEKDTHNMYLSRVIDKYARSNHFHKNKDDNTILPESTVFRYEKSNELINKLDSKTCKLEDLVEILRFNTNDCNKCIYIDYDKFKNTAVTNATFCIDSSSDYMTIYDYIGKSTLIINKNGKLISQTKL